MHHPGSRVEHGLQGRLSDEDGTASDVVDQDRSTRSERRGARGRLRNVNGRKEIEEPAAEAALGYQPQDSGMAVIQLQVHACGPADGDCNAHDRLVERRPIGHRQEVLVEDRGGVRAPAPPQRPEESATAGTNLCVNKALLVLRNDPLPLLYGPLTIDDELRRTRWIRADQLSHPTMVTAIGPSA